jgi:hypothetical protein
MRGLCSLCIVESQLCKSHIIPNALFRRLKKEQNTGNLIKFNDHRDSKVVRSQESWWERLLCQSCERKIRDYESCGLNLLRASPNAMVSRHDEGITFQNHSYKQFKLFLTSIVWRAAVSKQETFHNVCAPAEAIEAARVSLFTISKWLGTDLSSATPASASKLLSLAFRLLSLRKRLLSSEDWCINGDREDWSFV